MEITQLHDEIFDFLFQKHLEARARGEEFYFLTTEEDDKNPVQKYLKWDKGEWFFLTDTIIELSFWKSEHYRLFYPLVFIIDIEKKTFSLEINGNNLSFMLPINSFGEDTTSRTEPIKKEYHDFFRKVGQEVGVVWNEEENKGKKEYIGDNYLSILNDFIENDKKIIDKLIRNHTFLTGAKISFIEKHRFIQNITDIRQIKLSRNYANASQNQLLAFRNISIYNYKAIDFLTIETIPADTQWIILTGENGYGKTLILEAIAIGLYGKEAEEGTIFWEKLGRAYLETGFDWGGKIEMTFSDNFESGSGMFLSKEINRPRLLAYGSNRNFSDNEAKGTILHLFDNDMGLPFMQKEWYQKGINDTKQVQFNILKTKMTELGLEIEVDKENECLLFTQKNVEGESFDKVRFEELSAAYKSVFLLVGDIIYKFTEIKNEKSQYQDVLSGIVIIDEFELHLHPKMQRFLVEKLTKLFPKVQFIVSTHSPIPLLGAPKETVILHVDRTKEKGITVERLDDKIDFHTLLPEALLSSPIFDFDNFLRRNGQPFYKFSTENDYNEVVFDKMLEDKLAILAEKGGKTLADILKKKE